MQQDDILKMEKIEKRRKKREKDDLVTKPYLLKRVFAGFLDILLVFILFVLFEGALYLTLFAPLDYHKDIATVQQMYKESGLFIQYDEDTFVEISDYYDEEKSVEENYSDAIIYYYTHDERAVKDNLVNNYYDSLLESKLFDVNKEKGLVIKKPDALNSEAKKTMENEYEKALNHFKSNEDYAYLINRTYNIVMFTCLISILMATSIIYILIPLCRKEGETPSQILFKICIVDFRDQSQIKKWQILVRGVAVISINYLVPVLLYLKWNYFTLIPVFITLVMMCVMKYNKGPQDYVSISMVILKHRADAMDTLKSITKGNR